MRGASGAGKSTLALRCLEAGFRLVADDRVIVWRSGDTPYGRAPAPLAGLMEVRAVGVVAAARLLALAPIVLVVDLESVADRLPEPATVTIAGLAVPHLLLTLDDPDTALRLRAALAAVQRPV